MDSVSRGNRRATQSEIGEDVAAAGATMPPERLLPSVDFELLFERDSARLLVLCPDSPRFTIAGANDAYLDAARTQGPAIIGRGLFDVFPERLGDGAGGARDLRASLEHVAASRRADTMATERHDIPLPPAEGGGFSERFYRSVNTPVLASNGELRYIVHRVEDVTHALLVARRETAQCEQIAALTRRSELAERASARAEAVLEQANRELDAFSYSVSHDLRAPLRAIDGFSQALVADYASALDEQAKHYLDRVRAGAQRMSELIDDLLNLSRIHRSPVRRTRVNASELAARIISELQAQDPGRGIVVNISPDLFTNADAHLLALALRHLLGNAWKFTSKRAGAQIDFGQSSLNDATHWYVRDNGAGFDMAYAGRLFSPFQRMHKASEFAGSGIGLATVQRIVLCHGGRIWAEAAVNEGARFSFTLGADDA